MNMELTPSQYRILILVIGLRLGVALSLMAYALSHSWGAFIFLPICVILVYFQAFHPIKRKE